MFYERKVLGNKCLAQLNINLPAKHYIITAMNPVTGEKNNKQYNCIVRYNRKQKHYKIL